MPVAGRHRVTTTLWEDEGTLCFQVDVKGVCVARRHDNNMINGTKLLNVCGMSRGKRDGILKNEKERIVVKVGAMHLKGVWIAFNRAKQLAEQHGIADALYPLFEPNIQSFLYHPDNYPRTAAVMAAAQERHRHYALPNTATTPVKDVSGADMNSNMPLQSNMSSSQWGSPHQSSHDGSNTNNGADAALHYQYQHHPHYQTPGPAMPVQNTNSATPNAMFNSPSAHYQTQSVQAPVRSIPAANLGMERRFDQPAEAQVSSQSLAQQAQISSQQSSQMPHSTQDPIASAEGVTSPTGTTTTASPSTKHHQTEQTDSGSELVHKEEAGSSTIQSASERAGGTQEEGDVQTETYAATSLPTESYSSSEKPKDEDETSSAKQSELYADGQAKLGSDSEEKTASSS
ncbi:RNA polymerase II transcription regulator [Malassezia pachydermatis]